MNTSRKVATVAIAVTLYGLAIWAARELLPDDPATDVHFMDSVALSPSASICAEDGACVRPTPGPFLVLDVTGDKALVRDVNTSTQGLVRLSDIASIKTKNVAH